MDFFKEYMQYAGVGVSEAPAIFHRWTAISIIGAIVGRNTFFTFGHSKIYPNQFIFLLASPGVKKSTAINIGKELLRGVGYNKFSANRTSKEQFIADLVPKIDPNESLEDTVVRVLSESSISSIAEAYIAIGEFTDFIGIGNSEFATLLTNLWDNLPEYEHPKLNGKSIKVYNPTINLLGGATPQGFATALPSDIIGGGFLSRVILVHGEFTRKVTFPPAKDKSLEEGLKEHLIKISKIRGEMLLTVSAISMIDRIYNVDFKIPDSRFQYYGSRRLGHLIKLSMVIALSRLSKEIEISDVLQANSLLHCTERKMPEALGEFGRSKASELSNTVLNIIKESDLPLDAADIFRSASHDVSRISEVQEVIKNLLSADKIQQITLAKKTGYMVLNRGSMEWDSSLLDNSWLLPIEIGESF